MYAYCPCLDSFYGLSWVGFHMMVVSLSLDFARCLTVSPNFEIAKNNMAIALTDLGTKVMFFFYIYL